MGTQIDWSLVVGIAGGILSVLGVMATVVQTIRYETSQRNLEQLKRTRNANIWSNIGMILQAYDSIDDAREIAKQQSAHSEILAKINSTRRSIVNQYLQLIKEAVLDEDEFTEETVKEWKRLGRLENEWRVAQAMKFVQPGKERITSKAGRSSS